MSHHWCLIRMWFGHLVTLYFLVLQAAIRSPIDLSPPFFLSIPPCETEKRQPQVRIHLRVPPSAVFFCHFHHVNANEPFVSFTLSHMLVVSSLALKQKSFPYSSLLYEDCIVPPHQWLLVISLHWHNSIGQQHQTNNIVILHQLVRHSQDLAWNKTALFPKQ